MMIVVYPYEKLGHADHGWLDARHHFSFAGYWNPQLMGFGVLRVVNDDRVNAGTGFGMHPHDNMEIITYVRQGVLTHKDSMGNVGRTGAGDVQVMSAGTGVTHAEHNRGDEPVRLYQIWIEPNQRDVAPRWETRIFPKEAVVSGSLPVLASGRAEDVERGALLIHQDAALCGGRLSAGTEVRHPIKGSAYLLASAGRFRVNDVLLSPGDGCEITGEKLLVLRAETDAEILVIDVPEVA